LILNGGKSNINLAEIFLTKRQISQKSGLEHSPVLASTTPWEMEEIELKILFTRLITRHRSLRILVFAD
jgi:hypothetical protein